MKRIKLGEVLDVKRGASLAGEFYSERGEKIRLTLGNFKYPGGGFKQNTSKKDIYFNGPVKPEFILNKGDIITPLTEQVAGLLGETARIPEGNLYIQSGDIGLVIPDERLLDKDFAYYLVSSPLVKKQLDAAAQQTKIRHTSPDAIKDCVSYIPELMEQKKIAKLLDAINDKVTNNNAIAAELEGMAKDLYDYWFIQFDFPDENGKPYKSSGGKMVWNEELKREIPEGWEIENLYSIAEPINGLACQKYRPKNDEESLPVVKIKEMHTGITTDTERVSSNIPEKNKIFDGDILFSWSATLEVMFWFGGNAGLNQHIFKIVPINGYTKEYVYHQYSAYVINFVKMAEARKTTMGHITTDHLEQSRIILPPINVVQAFSKITAPIYEKIGTCKQECNDLTSLRDFLLPMLMNGQVKAG